MTDKREWKRKEAGKAGIVGNQVDVSSAEKTKQAKSRKVDAAEKKEIRRAPIIRKSRAANDGFTYCIQLKTIMQSRSDVPAHGCGRAWRCKP